MTENTIMTASEPKRVNALNCTIQIVVPNKIVDYLFLVMFTLRYVLLNKKKIKLKFVFEN